MINIKDWKNYFDQKNGRGFLATADSSGSVNIAVYSRPHVLEDGRWAFIVANHRSLKFLKENPKAAFAFESEYLQGFRFYLDMSDLLEEGQLYEKVISESRKPKELGDDSDSVVAVFTLIETRPLVGNLG